MSTCTISDAACWTIAQTTEILAAETSGHGPDRQEIRICRGRWGYRVVEVWGSVWASYQIERDELSQVQADLRVYATRKQLYNFGALLGRLYPLIGAGLPDEEEVTP